MEKYSSQQNHLDDRLVGLRRRIAIQLSNQYAFAFSVIGRDELGEVIFTPMGTQIDGMRRLIEAAIEAKGSE